MAIRIYLDSSDYSIFYREPRSDETAEVLNFLIAKKNSNEIEIGFSYPVIWELLQDFSEEYRPDRIKRAEMIKMLCGQNVFRFPYNIKGGSAFSNKGDWYPQVENQISVSVMEQAWIDAIVNNKTLIPNRQARKAFTRNRREFIRKNPSICDLRRLDTAQTYLPASFLDNDVFYRYMVGEITARQADIELLKIITDPVMLIRSWFDMAKKRNPFTDTVHSSFEDLRSGIATIQNLYKSMLEASKQLKEIERGLYKSGGAPETIRAVKEQRRNMMESLKLQRYFNADKGIWAVLGDHTVEVVIAYLNSHLTSNQVLKDSDIADIYHAIYIPYCELWRGDSAFSNMLIRQGITNKDKIVPTLRELPQRITAMM